MECGSEGHTLLGWMVEFDTNVNAWDPAEGSRSCGTNLFSQGEQDSHTIFWTDIYLEEISLAFERWLNE